MTEKLLQFIWQFGYYNKTGLATTNGEPLSIQFAGSLNKNQGPDFSGGRIKIGNTTFAGSIELHLKTSDWRRHLHEGDENYRNVILHVVFEHDEHVNELPVLELSHRVSSVLLQTYTGFMESASFIPCGEGVTGIKELVWKGWKERLLIERLTRKAGRVLQLLTESNNHWEEVFWWLLARSFGGNINGEAFEAIARSLPLNILAKQKASIHQLEALLLGQAGLLAADFSDDYPNLLQREYRFLAGKYGLQPVAFPVLFHRMRPGNFPTLRLAQLAALVQQSVHLFSRIVDTDDLARVEQEFAVTANDYWHYHYTFQQVSAFKRKTLGADMTANVLINTVVPVLFAYGLYHNDEKHKEKALRWLDALPAETNTITKGFASVGVQNKSAYDSQALLELKNEYCAGKRCLDCSVGNFLLRDAAATYTPSSRNDLRQA